MDSYIIYLSDWDDYASLKYYSNLISNDPLIDYNNDTNLLSNYFFILSSVFLFGTICSMIICSYKSDGFNSNLPKNEYKVVEVSV